MDETTAMPEPTEYKWTESAPERFVEYDPELKKFTGRVLDDFIQMGWVIDMYAVKTEMYKRAQGEIMRAVQSKIVELFRFNRMRELIIKKLYATEKAQDYSVMMGGLRDSDILKATQAAMAVINDIFIELEQ